MPLVRFKIRNELSLGGPELNRSPAVEYEESKVILDAVEVAGLVGILRQLGDLAEFSAEVFSGIQEEVTVTASRCQKLTSRVKRIESALSPLEKAVLSQTSHIHFVYTSGCEWHPRIKNGQRHFVQSDLPLCVMETYEQCRDPPPLHLLDRFDAGGPGSCLRKYSDPTFFRNDLGNPSKSDDAKAQKDQTHRKRKKKRLPQRNICRSRAVSTSDETNGDRLSSLTDDRPTTSHSTSTVDMPRSSNMQDLSDIIDQSHLQEKSNSLEQSEAQVQSDLQESPKPRDSITGSGYIEYVINQSPVNKPEANLKEGFLSASLQPADRIGSAVPEGRVEVVDDNILYSRSEDVPVPYASIVCDEKKETLESRVEKSNKEEEVSEIHESKIGPGTPDRVRQNQRDFGRTYDFFDEVDTVEEKQSKSLANSIDGKPGIESERENKSEQGSDADEFVDARNTIESESDSELDGTPKPKLEHYFGDISTYCSEDASSDNNGGSEDTPCEEMVEDQRHENSLDESCSGLYLPDDASVSCGQSDPVCGKILSRDENFQRPREFSAMCPSLLAEEAFPDETVLRDEPVAVHPLLAGDCANENISFEELISSGMSPKDAIPAQKILPEEHLANYPYIAEAVPLEKILPSVAKYPSSVEAMPDNTTPAEEPGATHPPFPKAVHVKIIPPEVLDSKNLSGTVPETVSEEQVPVEDFVGVSPCLAEVVPDERFLTEEPEEAATPCMSSSKVVPLEKLLPEKPLEAPQFVAELPQKKILPEKSVDSKHSSRAKAASPEEKLPPQVLDSTNFSVVEAVSHEQIGLEEFDGIYPCLAETVPDEKFLTEEQEEAIPDENIVTYARKEVVPDEKFLTEEREEAVSDENFLTEEREEAATTYASSSKAIEKLLPEKPLEAHRYLTELPQEKILPEKPVGSAHPSCAKAAPPEENLSPEVLGSTNLSVAEAVLQEQIELENFVGIYPCFPEAVSDERVLPEEPVTTCVSLTKAMAIEKTLPEELLETYPSLAELAEEKISHEEANDATLPFEAVNDEKFSQEVSGYTNLSLEEALLQEKISLEEFVGIDPCLAEAVPDERFLSVEPVTTCLSLKKAATTERIPPEKPLETYPSFAELPEEKIVHEEAGDVTHLSVSEYVHDEQISPEVLESTNFPVAAALPQEQTLLEEFVGSSCQTEAVSDKRVLPEEPVTTYLSLKKAASNEGVLLEKPLETYLPFAELPEEKIVHEEADDAPYASVSEAVSDDRISPVFDPAIFPVASTLPQEQILLEEFVGNPYLGEAVTDKKVLPEEPVTTCMSLETYPPFAELPEEKIVHEEADDATYTSVSEAVSDKKISLEVPDSTIFPVAIALPEEQILLEKFVGNPYLAEAVPDTKVLPEEPVTTCMSLTKPEFIQEVWPEEPLEAYASLEKSSKDEISQEKSDDGSHPSCAKVESDENVSEGALDSENLPVAEATPQEKIALKEFVGTYPCFAEAVPDERVLPEEPVTTRMSLTKDAPIEKFLPEEPLEVYPSLEEMAEEKISQEEESDDDTHPYFPEAVGYETISPLEHPCSTYPSLEESVPHEKTSNEEVGTNPFLELAVPNVSSFPDKPGVIYQSSAEAVSEEKNLPEEPLLTYPSLAEAVLEEKITLKEPDTTCPPSAEAIFAEKISSLEAPGYTTEAGSHNTEAPASTAETGPHDKTSPEEPVATYMSLAEPVQDDNVLPKEPAAAYLDLSEGIPDQKVFLDDAAFLSFAEAIFDQKFSPEVPDSMDLPGKNILVKEAETYDEPESADRTNGTIVEPVNIWSNGGLLGLAPSKPPVFAGPNSVSEHIQNEINEAGATATKKQESSSRSVENTEKSPLPLVFSDPTSQQQSNMLSHSNGSLSHLQSTATSFKVFGLSHRLLMAGFGGNSSSVCKFESIPTTSYDTKAAAIEDKPQQTPSASSFEEQLGYESSLFRSPTSSPLVEHMKISLNPIDPSPVSKLKLKIPSQPQYNGENVDTFPSFQLVPEASNSDGDDNSDIFCQSSPSVSDNCLSDSELWESDETPRESVSSFKQAGERSTHVGSFSGSFLDLPCFDSVDHQATSSRLEQEQERERELVPEYKPSVSEIIRDWPPDQPAMKQT